MESTCGPDGSGLRIAEVEPGRFVEFARHHARSEEIGPIATVFDGPRPGAPPDDHTDWPISSVRSISSWPPAIKFWSSSWVISPRTAVPRV